MFRRLWLFMILALPLTAPFWAQNEADIYRAVSPSVVSIEVEISWSDTAGGTGFVIDKDGHIVTNAHVVEDARALTVKFHDGYEAPAKLIGMDTRVDLAVIQVDVALHQLKPVTFGDSDALVVGQRVLAIGSPYGLEATLTTGIISGLNRSLENNDGTTMEGAIQTDAALTSGNSGGPLLDQAGEVIGVNTAGYRGTALGFAIPSNTVQRVVESMISMPIPTVAPYPTSTPLVRNWFPTPTANTPVPTEKALHATFKAILAATDTAQARETAWQVTWNAVLAQRDLEETATAAATGTAKAVQSTFEAWMTGTANAIATEQFVTREAQRRATANARATRQLATANARATEQSTVLSAWTTFESVVASYGALAIATQIFELASAGDAIDAELGSLGLSRGDLSSFTFDPQNENHSGALTAVANFNELVDEEVSDAVWAMQTLRDAAPEYATDMWSMFAAEFTTVTAMQRATARAVQTATADARVTSTPTPYRVVVDGAVNLRSGPGTNHARVGVARPGDTFAVIGYQAGNQYNWLKVRYDDGVAWIAESFTQAHG